MDLFKMTGLLIIMRRRAMRPLLALLIALGAHAGAAVAQAPDPFLSDTPTRGPTAKPRPRPAIPPAGPGVVQDCADCPQLVAVPAGSFAMGVPAEESRREGTSDANARPVHVVRIAQALLVGRFPVTRGEYTAFARATGAAVPKPPFAQDDRHPVVDVTWLEAEAYVSWLARRTGKPYRLLTESEWEYSARAGAGTARYWGDSADGQCLYAKGFDRSGQQKHPDLPVQGAPCDSGFPETAPVGHFRPNAFGLYDMLGNVHQWVQDCYGASSYAGAPSDGSAVTTGDCMSRAVRGGSWFNRPANLRSGRRDGAEAMIRSDTIGFRVVRPLAQP